MRLFYAAFLDPENRRSYEALIAKVIADVGNVIRPVPSGSQHQTLAFLGDIDDREVGRYVEILELTKDFPEIPFTLRHPAILYGRGTPRLVKADLDEGSERALALQKALRLETGEDPRTLERRLKHPHVTLARFRKNANKAVAHKVVDALSRLEDPGMIRTDRLSSVHLVKSTLTPSGPIYESVAESMLAG
jgi:2'-5' RNA ligase